MPLSEPEVNGSRSAEITVWLAPTPVTIFIEMEGSGWKSEISDDDFDVEGS